MSITRHPSLSPQPGEIDVVKNLPVAATVLASLLMGCLATPSSTIAAGLLPAFERSDRRAIYWDFLRLDREPPKNMNISSGVHAAAFRIPLSSELGLF